ncbi:MAG: Ycf66 family protein [Cyanobacteria bacterium SBLK]|nr:Ycf66 family protein [Cyanobacteria bacterium SBLK]
MVNFGWSAASILGIFLIVAGAGLYFLRSIRPEVSRDYDIFFSAVGLACGIILVFNGWRLDPILQFSQLLLAASTAFFAFETIRLRGLATEQAKRTTPIVDDERPPSRRPYYAERVAYNDEIESEWEERAKRPRLVGRTERLSEYDEDSLRSRSRPRDDREPPNRGRRPPRPPSPPDRRDRPSSRPPKNDPYASAGRYDDRVDEWEDDWDEPETGRDRPSDYDDRPSRDRPSRRPSRDRDEDSPRSRPSSSRPSSRSSSTPRKNSPRSYEDEEPATYVDYVDYSEVDDEKDEDFEDFDRSDEEREDFEDFDRPEEGDRYDDRNDRYDDDEDEDWEDDRKKGDRFDY